MSIAVDVRKSNCDDYGKNGHAHSAVDMSGMKNNSNGDEPSEGGKIVCSLSKNIQLNHYK